MQNLEQIWTADVQSKYIEQKPNCDNYSIRIKMKAVDNIQDLPYPGVLTP